MVFVFVVVGALLVFAIAAAFVGSEAFRLGHTPTTTVFDLDEAVIHVAENLSVESAMGLTMDEVKQLIEFSLQHLRSRGLSAMPGEDIDHDVERAPVVVADDEAVAVVLGRADEVRHGGDRRGGLRGARPPARPPRGDRRGGPRRPPSRALKGARPDRRERRYALPHQRREVVQHMYDNRLGTLEVAGR